MFAVVSLFETVISAFESETPSSLAAEMAGPGEGLAVRKVGEVVAVDVCLALE